MEEVENKISLRSELLRKAIHISSSLIPLSYYFIEKDILIIFLYVFGFLLMLMDLTKLRYQWVQRIYLKFLGPVLRSHELQNKKLFFTGGTYLVIAFLICVLLFSKPVAITSMLIIVFCDSAAAIVGKVYGKHFVKNKTLEGSAAFFITGVAVILLTPKATDSSNEFFLALSALLLTTIFEIIPNKIDDNISIPIFFGITYSILIKIFL
ncbi:MAG: diacylglycerol/polyprenol kinase family protein [Ignavibacteria bacterium]